MNDRLLSRTLPMLPPVHVYDTSTWEHQMISHYWDALSRVAYQILMMATSITGVGTSGNAATLSLSSYYFEGAAARFGNVSVAHPNGHRYLGAHLWQNLGIAYSGLVATQPLLEQQLILAWYARSFAPLPIFSNPPFRRYVGVNIFDWSVTNPINE
jgi:hypothetical protein